MKGKGAARLLLQRREGLLYFVLKTSRGKGPVHTAVVMVARDMAKKPRQSSASEQCRSVQFSDSRRAADSGLLHNNYMSESGTPKLE